MKTWGVELEQNSYHRNRLSFNKESMNYENFRIMPRLLNLLFSLSEVFELPIR